MKTFTEYRPNFVSGYENSTYALDSIEDLYEIEFVHNFTKVENFHNFYRSEDHLMALYKFDEETKKCKEWWVVGTLKGFSEEDFLKFGLEDFRNFI